MDWNIYIRNPEVNAGHIKALKRSNFFLCIAIFCTLGYIHILNKRLTKLEKKVKEE